VQDGRSRPDHGRHARRPAGLRQRHFLHAAQVKNIESVVAGQADILAVPDLESGNMLAKQLQYLAGADSAGIVLGARVPIVLTSRADSSRRRQSWPWWQTRGARGCHPRSRLRRPVQCRESPARILNPAVRGRGGICYAAFPGAITPAVGELGVAL
jgi:hypothetical protein